MAAGSIEVEVGEAIARRRAAGLALVDLSGDLTRAAHAMATRFRRGGALIAFGVGMSSADAQHVAVEFAHPVVVGKRAVPALALTGDVATLSGLAEHGEAGSLFAYPVEHLARPGDVVIALIGAEPSGARPPRSRPRAPSTRSRWRWRASPPPARPISAPTTCCRSARATP